MISLLIHDDHVYMASATPLWDALKPLRGKIDEAAEHDRHWEKLQTASSERGIRDALEGIKDDVLEYSDVPAWQNVIKLMGWEE